jgi:PAS domain-containing protein
VLWIASGDGQRLEYVSPGFEQIWGIERQRVLEDLSIWTELLHPDDRAQAMTGMPRLLAGETVTTEYRIIARWERALDPRYGFPICGPSGVVHRVGGIAHDITEERRGARSSANPASGSGSSWKTRAITRSSRSI